MPKTLSEELNISKKSADKIVKDVFDLTDEKDRISEIIKEIKSKHISTDEKLFACFVLGGTEKVLTRIEVDMKMKKSTQFFVVLESLLFFSLTLVSVLSLSMMFVYGWNWIKVGSLLVNVLILIWMYRKSTN